MAEAKADGTHLTAASRITSLPLELLWEVASYLPVSGHIALKLSCRSLLLSIPEPPRDWNKNASRCERKAHRRHINEARDLADGKRRCVNCDLVTYSGRFPTSAPLCKWHEPRFMSNSIPGNLDTGIRANLKDVARASTGPSWVALERLYCAHSREIIGWHEADCNCDCDSCGHFPVPCFVRIPSKRDTRYWRSSKLSEDGLSVHEEHWIDSKLLLQRRCLPLLTNSCSPW